MTSRRTRSPISPEAGTAMGMTIPRRRFLQAAGAAGVFSGGLTDAQAESAAPARAGGGPADLVLKNGKIITVDSASTIARAIAIAGDRIVAVGPDDAMSAHTSPTTRVVDL